MIYKKPTVKIGGWTDGSTNVIEPSDSKKNTGWGVEKPPHQFFNWFWFTMAKWIDWFYSLNINGTDQERSWVIDSGSYSTNSGIGCTMHHCTYTDISSDTYESVMKDTNYASLTACQNVEGRHMTFSYISNVNGGIFKTTYDVDAGVDYNLLRVLCLNSSYGLIDGKTDDSADIEVINTTGFTAKGNMISLKNCSNVSASGDRISMEGVSDHSEIINGMRVFDNWRPLGTRYYKNKIVNDTTINNLGNSLQKICGNRKSHTDILTNAIWWYLTGDDWDTSAGASSTKMLYVSDGSLITRVTGGLMGYRLLFSGASEASASFVPITASYVLNESWNVTSFWINFEANTEQSASGTFFGYNTNDPSGSYADSYTIVGRYILSDGTVSFFNKHNGNTFTVKIPNVKAEIWNHVAIKVDNVKNVAFIFWNGELAGTLPMNSSTMTSHAGLTISFGQVFGFAEGVNNFSICEFVFDTGTNIPLSEVKLLTCGGYNAFSDKTDLLESADTIVRLTDSNKRYGINIEPLGYSTDGTFIYLDIPERFRYATTNNRIDRISIVTELYNSQH